jgi:hypothetical protein
VADKIQLFQSVEHATGLDGSPRSDTPCRQSKARRLRLDGMPLMVANHEAVVASSKALLVPAGPMRLVRTALCSDSFKTDIFGHDKTSHTGNVAMIFFPSH